MTQAIGRTGGSASLANNFNSLIKNGNDIRKSVNYASDGFAQLKGNVQRLNDNRRNSGQWSTGGSTSQVDCMITNATDRGVSHNACTIDEEIYVSWGNYCIQPSRKLRLSAHCVRNGA